MKFSLIPFVVAALLGGIIHPAQAQQAAQPTDIVQNQPANMQEWAAQMSARIHRLNMRDVAPELTALPGPLNITLRFTVEPDGQMRDVMLDPGTGNTDTD